MFEDLAFVRLMDCSLFSLFSILRCAGVGVQLLYVGRRLEYSWKCLATCLYTCLDTSLNTCLNICERGWPAELDAGCCGPVDVDLEERCVVDDGTLVLE